MFSNLEHRKRARENDDEGLFRQGLSDKKARPMETQRDSVIETSAVSPQAREPYRFDSDDDRASSIMSDHDMDMSSGDEDIDDDSYAQSPRSNSFGNQHGPNPWSLRVQTNRVPTPIMPSRPGQIRTSFMTHVRQRHPQQFASELLEVPSPIDEDEVPTPPSAAEAAGSQFSMLSVSDMDMDTSDTVPTVTIDPARPVAGGSQPLRPQLDTDVNRESDQSGSGTVIVRKQRQRSGALSSGDSPVRAEPSNAATKRGFTMGFRADCEKCRLRVPGHMNHFLS